MPKPIHMLAEFFSTHPQHLTKWHRIPLFIDLPDGEMFLQHLTKHLTRAPTIHLCSVAGGNAVPPLR